MATHCSILPKISHGQRSLAGYSPKDCKELDMTEWLSVRVRTHTHTHTRIRALMLMFGKVIKRGR